MFTRYYQYVYWCLRVDILDGYDLAIFVNDFRRRAAGDDAAEQTLFQIDLNLLSADG